MTGLSFFAYPMYNFNNLEFMGPSNDLTAKASSLVFSPGVKTSPALWLSKIRSASRLSLSGFGVSVIIKKMSNLLNREIGILT